MNWLYIIAGSLMLAAFIFLLNLYANDFDFQPTLRTYLEFAFFFGVLVFAGFLLISGLYLIIMGIPAP